MLDVLAQNVLHLRQHRIGQNTPGSKRSGTELHPVLIPPHDLSCRQQFRASLLRLCDPLIIQLEQIQILFDSRLVGSWPQTGVLHYEVPGIPEKRIMDMVACANCEAIITRCWLDENVLKL